MQIKILEILLNHLFSEKLLQKSFFTGSNFYKDSLCLLNNLNLYLKESCSLTKEVKSLLYYKVKSHQSIEFSKLGVF